MTDSNMSDSSRQGSSMTSDLKDAAGQTYEDVRTKALDAVSRTTEAARSQAMEQAEVAKSTLADTAERLAQSVRQSVEGGDQSMQGKLMFAAADAISDMSTSLRGQSFQDLVGRAAESEHRHRIDQLRQSVSSSQDVATGRVGIVHPREESVGDAVRPSRIDVELLERQ